MATGLTSTAVRLAPSSANPYDQRPLPQPTSRTLLPRNHSGLSCSSWVDRIRATFCLNQGSLRRYSPSLRLRHWLAKAARVWSEVSCREPCRSCVREYSSSYSVSTSRFSLNGLRVFRLLTQDFTQPL